MNPRKRISAITLLAAALALAACSGVPSASKPQVIRQVVGGVVASSATVAAPPITNDPRVIVNGFLDDNVSEDANHTGARAFLTPDASKTWVDTTAKVVATGSLSTGVADPATNTVTVMADQVGSLDNQGVYTPVINSATGSTPLILKFGLVQVKGQWRINRLLSGLIIEQSQFTIGDVYRATPLFFFDQSQRRLVQDVRYSPLTGQSLCTWLLGELAAGPRTELASAYTTDLPEQTTHATATLGPNAIVIELPGANQLDPNTRTRLAVQLANTFNIDFLPPISLTDGGKPVAIPQIESPFTVGSVPAFVPVPTAPTVYYTRDGSVYSDDGTKVFAGAAGTSGLLATAVAQRNRLTLLAATKGPPDSARLVIGRLDAGAAGLVTINVPAGPLTRPAWAAGLNEVWIGRGQELLRITSPSAGAIPTQSVPVALSSVDGTVSGTIRSVALSPDGVHIALILATGDGASPTSQLWIGVIVRTADGASVESLAPITPTDLTLTDAAWNGSGQLYTIGADSRGGSYGIWSVQVDGSDLSSRSTTGLPSRPDSITVRDDSFPWVSAGGAVWAQSGEESNSWAPPPGKGITTYGTYPNYLE